LLGERLTTIPNSSRVFLGGAIAYSDRSKTALADVPAYLLAEHGAVSDQVARSLAEGIRRRTGSTLAVSITGIAGPASARGLDATKPVGLVYIALADGKDTQVKQFNITGDRDRVRLWSTQYALEMLRHYLQ
jgi:nicotinamide-nucleotide amidase